MEGCLGTRNGRKRPRVRVARASARGRGTGFGDDSVLHGPTTPYTMERVTLIVPWLKSISPHFKPNNSLCRNPVVAARSTSVRSRIAKPLTNALISAGVRIIGARAAFRALTNEVDWVTIKQLISAGMIEENGHEISDFGTAAFCQWQSAKPRLNLNGSNLLRTRATSELPTTRELMARSPSIGTNPPNHASNCTR